MNNEEADGPTYLSRSTELLWQTRERPTRGPKPTLTLGQIVDTAISVADTDGIDALSMRRVARDLGVGTMSLYRYVPGKAELLDLMLDHVSDPGKAVEEARGKDWRGCLEVSAWDSRALYLEHPWLIQVNWSRPVFGPNSLAGFEFLMSVLQDVNLTDQERVIVVTTVDAYVTGAVRHQLQYLRAAEETGVSDDEFWRHQGPVLEWAMSTGDYPTLATLEENAFDAGWEESFEFGLRCLLDGLERFVADRARKEQ